MRNGRIPGLALLASVSIINWSVDLTGPTLRSLEQATSAKVLFNEDPETVSTLWEEVINAKAGREKLHDVHGLYVVQEQGQGDREWNFYLFPNRYFHYSYGRKREDSVIKVFNADLGLVWWQPNQSPAQLRRLKRTDEDDAPIIKAQFILLLETRWLAPKPLGMRKEWVGLKRVHVVETDVAGWRVDYYLDPNSHLPLKITFGFSSIERARGEMDYEVRLQEYFKLGEVMMPRKLTHTIKSKGSIWLKWSEQIRYEINPSYDDKVFERAPTRKLGPEAWRSSER